MCLWLGDSLRLSAEVDVSTPIIECSCWAETAHGGAVLLRGLPVLLFGHTAGEPQGRMQGAQQLGTRARRVACSMLGRPPLPRRPQPVSSPGLLGTRCRLSAHLGFLRP